MARLLRNMRHAAGLSQAALARRIGTDRRTIARIESATRAPRDDIIVAWEQVTGLVLL